MAGETCVEVDLGWLMQAAIYGLSGLALTPDEARFLPRRRSRRLYPVQAQLRRPRADALADRRACARSTAARICRS